MCVRVLEYSHELEDVLEYAHILEYRYVHKGGHSAVGRGNFGVQVPRTWMKGGRPSVVDE